MSPPPSPPPNGWFQATLFTIIGGRSESRESLSGLWKRETDGLHRKNQVIHNLYFKYVLLTTLKRKAAAVEEILQYVLKVE